jgi:hypothetical protein
VEKYQSNSMKAMLAAGLLCLAVQSNATEALLTLSIGGQSADEGTFSVSGQSAQEVVTFDSGESIAIGWGVGDDNAKFLFEYYYSSIDINSLESLDKSSLFYSGYWTPELYFGIKGVLGAGVGITYIDLPRSGAGSTAFKDRELEYKFSIGLEYQLCKSVGVYGLYERIYGNEYSDTYLLAGDAGVATALFDDSDQSRISLGISYTY